MKLIIEDDEGRKTVVPFVRDEITIGRMEGNTIRLTERNVSRRHAKLLRQNGHVLIEDLGSYNGIRINGDRIAGQVQVTDGDLIQIGDYDLAIQAEDGPLRATNLPISDATVRSAPVVSQVSAPTARLFDPSTRLTETAATVPHLPIVDMPQAADDDVHDDIPPDDGEGLVGDDAPPEMSRAASTAVIRSDQVEARKRQVSEVDPAEAPRLVVLNTELAGREFLCTRSEMKIGRTDDNDVPLDHRSLSRTHCKLVREDNGEWRVIDLQSANGLMVNGEPYAQATLRFGDLIELGHLKLQFVGPGEQVSLPSSASAEVAPRSASRAPMVALITAVAVVLLGGGGYAFWKSHTPAQSPKSDPARVEPVAKDPNSGAIPPLDPELARKLVAKKVDDAKAAIADLDWDQARSLLRDPHDGVAINLEAQALIDQMAREEPSYKAIVRARELLEKGDPVAASTELEGAKDSELLKNEYRRLDEERAKLFKAKMAVMPVAEKKPKVAAPAPPPPPVVPYEGTPEAQVALQEGKDHLKARELESAKASFEKCKTIDPKFSQCYRYLGIAHSLLKEPDTARAFYLEYTRRGTDPEDLAKVRAILKRYEEDLKKTP